MNFETRVKLFKKELEELLKKYKLDMYSGWIGSGDDEDIVIKDKQDDGETYLNLWELK